MHLYRWKQKDAPAHMAALVLIEVAEQRALGFVLNCKFMHD